MLHVAYGIVLSHLRTYHKLNREREQAKKNIRQVCKMNDLKAASFCSPRKLRDINLYKLWLHPKLDLGLIGLVSKTKLKKLHEQLYVVGDKATIKL